ncbi:hypothetical protein ACJDU8_13335 [Clostridium sp. WILCCON 0269]|uniref:Methyltransferase domain-containing protein n=1 Tax=Candidatus Clostridium eludens TaxID=3381663 RepID=A0ABW8SMF0_9CLOT
MHKTLKEQFIHNNKVDKALVIGSGNGTNAIGISELFKPYDLYVTDLMKDTLPTIKQNIETFVAKQDIKVIESDLFKKLEKQEFDLIKEYGKDLCEKQQ